MASCLNPTVEILSILEMEPRVPHAFFQGVIDYHAGKKGSWLLFYFIIFKVEVDFSYYTGPYLLFICI